MQLINYNNIKNYIVVVKYYTDEWKQTTKKFYINKQIYDYILECKKTKCNDDIVKIENLTIKIKDILQFEEIKIPEIKEWDIITCQYWHKHNAWNVCKCYDIYRKDWITFFQRLKFEMWYNIYYDSDITREMQEEYLKKYVNK
jgi:hypothetical protein